MTDLSMVTGIVVTGLLLAPTDSTVWAFLLGATLALGLTELALGLTAVLSVVLA